MAFGEFLLHKERRVHSIAKYFAALNHYYEVETGMRPFKGKQLSRVAKGYAEVATHQSQLENKAAPLTRVAIPSDMLQTLTEYGCPDQYKPWLALGFVSIFGILFAPVATCFSVRALCLVVLLFSTRLTSSAFLWRYVAAVPTDFVCFTKFHFLVELGDGCFSVLALWSPLRGSSPS
jgi:hypothetical protein